jgi:GTP-binding protein
LRHQSASFVKSATKRSELPATDLPEVAFLGRSNVGKSSLLNVLAGTRGLARVSSTPGRTQLINFFCVQPQGSRQSMHLVDLPGYGYSKVPEAVRRSFETLVTSYLVGRPNLALCVLLVDLRHEAQPGDLKLHTWLHHHQIPFRLVATKADKVSRGERKRHLAALERDLAGGVAPPLAVSAETGEGIKELWQSIREATTV